MRNIFNAMYYIQLILSVYVKCATRTTYYQHPMHLQFDMHQIRLQLKSLLVTELQKYKRNIS